MAQNLETAPDAEGALARLAPRMQAFARAYVAHGKRNAGKAYVEAGYKASNAHVASVNACNLLHRADVQQAIQEICRRDLVALAPVANSVAQELLQNEQLEPGVRARLVMGIWDRTGLGTVSEIKHTVEHIGNDPHAIGQIRTLMQSLNLTDEQAEAVFGRTVVSKAKKLPAPITIEAEYEEVEDDLGINL